MNENYIAHMQPEEAREWANKLNEGEKRFQEDTKGKFPLYVHTAIPAFAGLWAVKCEENGTLHGFYDPETTWPMVCRTFAGCGSKR